MKISPVTGMCLVLIGLIQQALATVKPRPSARSSYTIGPKDRFTLYMNELFDLSGSSNPYFKVQGSNARMVNFTTPFRNVSLESFDIHTIHQIVDLGNGIVGILFNNKSALFLPFSKDGKHFGQPVLFSDTNIGVNTVCDDMVLNTDAARVYISCHQIGTSKQEPGSAYVYEVDYQTGDRIQKITIDQSDGYFVESTSKLRLVDLVQGSGRTRFLIFYSQALGGSLGLRSNFFFRYLTGVDTGSLAYNPANVIDFQKTNVNFKIFYDLFQYKNELVLSGVPSTSDSIALTSCYFDAQSIQLVCRPAMHTTTIKLGWVGLLNDNKYVEVDLANANHTAICNAKGDFDGVNWLTNCYYNDSIAVYKDAFIRDVELDNSAVLVEFAHPDGSYLGYSVHLLRNKLNSLHQDLFGSLSEDRLVYIDPNNNFQTSIVWLVPDFAWIEAEKLIIGANSLTVTAFDDQTIGGIQATVTVNLQASYVGEVGQASTFTWPELDVLQGTYYNWPVDGIDFTGNALSYDMTFDSKTNLFMELHLYHTSKVDISILSDDPMSQDLRNVVVGDGYVIGKDSSNNLNFASCRYPGIAHFVCTVTAQYPLAPTALLYSKTNSFGGLSFVWVSDSTKGYTTFFLFNGKDVGTYQLQGIYPTDADAFMGREDTREVGFIAYGRNEGKAGGKVQQLEILKFDLTNVHSIEPYATLTSEDTQDGYLCPTKVNGNNFGFVAVTSVCPGEIFSDSRVIVFKFPGPVPAVEVPLPQNGSLINPEACYFPGGLLISGVNPKQNKPVLYMTNPFIEDPSEEYFGLEEYGLVDNVKLNCAEEQSLFSVTSKNQDGTMNIGVFYGYSRGSAQKRAHSLLKNQKVSRVTGFAMQHGMVHVTYDASDYPLFWVSYLKGPIFYTDVSTSAKTQSLGLAVAADTNMTGTVTVLAKNPNGVQFQTSKNFLLRSADTTISVTGQSNNELTKGTFDLEKVLKIEGPVFGASISGAPGVTLRERISTFSKYNSSGGQVYDIIGQSGSRTYAVDVDQGYSEVDYFDDGRYVRTLHGLGSGTFTAFTAILIDEPKAIDLVALSMVEGGRSQIFLYVYQAGIKKSAKVSTGRGTATELKGLFVFNNKVYLFAQSGFGVEFFVATISTDLSTVTVQLVNIFPNIIKFSPVYGKGNVVLLGFGTESNDLIGFSISPTDPSAITGPTAIPSEHKFRLTAIACRAELVGYMCVTNTLSSFISEVYISATLQVTQTYYHDKYGYYEGYEVDVCGNFLFMFGKTTKPGVVAMAILSWKTGKTGGTGKLFYGLQLPAPANQKVDIHYQAPFALVTNYEGSPGDAWLMVGLLSPNNPITFYEVSTFQLEVTDANADLGKLSLVFQGLSSSSTKLSDYFKTSGTSATKWWPFLVILAALIILSIGWVVYNRIKSEKNDTKEEANYGTVNSDKLLKDSTEGQPKEQL